MRENIKSNQTDLGHGNVVKLLFRLAFPAIIAQIINLLYNLVDRMYIGHIPGVGTDALTGVGVTMPLIMAISAFAALISMGGAPQASIMLGKGQPDKAEEILGNCTSVLVLLSITLTILFQIFAKPLLMAFGASDNTIGYAWNYMQIYSLGTIFVQISLGLNAFITCQGYAKTSMCTVAIGAIINIILDPILIFGLNLGVRGAALATIISQAVSAVWVVRFLTSGKSFLRIRKACLRIQPKVVLTCISLGVAPFIMQFTESVLFICFNASLLKYGGDLAVGSMTILMSAMQLTMLPLNGLTQGAQPIISFNYGAKNPDRVKKTFFALLAACFVFASFMWSVCMFNPEVLIRLFNNDPELIVFATKAMRVYMSMVLVFSAQVACQHTFIALGMAKCSVFIALLRKVFLLIPLIYILPVFLEDKTMAVFLAEPIADLLSVITTVTLFVFSFKRVLREMREA